MQAGVINMTSNKSADPLSVLFHFGISILYSSPSHSAQKMGGG